MFKRAFTLIELLVVIAIIAILAAILFPVFAQAKLAAKSAASISNVKQIGLAELMYAGDADDMMVQLGFWNSGDVDNFINVPGGHWASWALVMDPYQKNVGINGSPVAGPLVRGTEIARRVGTRLMNYGYNYTFLSPSSYAAGWPTPMQSISSTSVNKPATTVMYTDRAARESYGDVVYWYGPSTGWVIIGSSEEPWCYNDPQWWCTDGWGTGSWYQGYVHDIPNGQLTGGVAPRNNNMVNVTFCDGHTKKLALGALAAGTNWNPNIADSAIVMVDMSKYLWSTQ